MNKKMHLDASKSLAPERAKNSDKIVMYAKQFKKMDRMISVDRKPATRHFKNNLQDVDDDYFKE